MERVTDKIEDICSMAERHGWEFLCHQENIKMLSFVRGDDRVNVYYRKMHEYVVGSCINHPTKGKTQLFRRHLREWDLEKIFKKPRVHTGLGYYKRPKEGF